MALKLTVHQFSLKFLIATLFKRAELRCLRKQVLMASCSSSHQSRVVQWDRHSDQRCLVWHPWRGRKGDCVGHLLVAWPGSHPGGIGPDGETVQFEHSLAPGVDGQRDTEDANDVHDYSCPCLWRGNTEQLVSLMNLKKKLEGLSLYKCTCSVRILK